MAEAQESRAKVGMEESDSASVLVPRDFEGAYRVATAFAKSSLVPKTYQGKPEDILVAWQFGGELGLGKMQSLQSIAVINGKPALPGETLLALALQSGELEDHEEIWDEKNKIATVTVKRRGRKPITHVFSWADAERIKTYEHGQQVSLASKDTYKNYPRRMCTMRARGFAFKDAFADLYKGLRTKEELEELPDDIDSASSKRVAPAMPMERETPVAAPVVDAADIKTSDSESQSIDSALKSEDKQQTTVVETEVKEVKETEATTESKKDALVKRVQAASSDDWNAVYSFVVKDLKSLSPADQLEVTKAINRRRSELFPA